MFGQRFPDEQSEQHNRSDRRDRDGQQSNLVRITFTAQANAPAGAAALSLTNVNASNDAAQSLAIGAMNGQVTITGPTAASVTISGQVFTPEGRGLRNARVTLTDQSGNARIVLTSAFGYYRFAKVVAGETYIIAVQSKRYQFAPQVISVNEELNELNFTAQSERFR